MTCLSVSHSIAELATPNPEITLQIMIDLNDALENSRRARAAITILRSALNVLETSSIVQSSEPTSTETPAPPAAPLTMADFSNDDPEVTIDSEGGIASVAAVVELPAAPPPPPPGPVESPTTRGKEIYGEASAPLPPAMPAPPGPAVPAELDSRGMPWDARIHASNRAKKIDNSWKNKRGVDAAMVAACEAQNKPGNAPTPITATPATVPAVAPATTAAPTAAASAPPPPPPPAPMAGIAAPAAVAPSAIDFRGLMQKIQGATAAGKLSADQVNAALAGVGLKPEEMAQLINNAPLIASVNAAVDKCIS